MSVSQSAATSLASPSLTSPSKASPSAMSPGLIVLILSLLLGLQPITTDLYLPALPVIVDVFGAPMTQAQLTLTSLLLAFGISQLIWGPLSDRFGRRPILLAGLSAFMVASVASALAANMPMLIVCRAVQGAAMGAGVMCARAIVRDLYTPMDAARVMSKGLTGLGIIACCCAPLGGLLTDLISWRAALMVLAIFGTASLAVVALRFEETLPQRNLNALQPAMLAHTWLRIARHPTFIAYSALATASYGVLFTFLAASSFVFIKVLGLTKTQYGLSMFSMSFVYMLGTLLCRRLLPRFGVRHSVAIAAGITMAGGITMLALALAGVQNLWAILLPFQVVMLAHGVHQPCSQSGAVGPFPESAGAASALNGFFMMVAAFFMGGWLGTHMDGTIYPLVYGVFFWCVLIALAGWLLVQKHGDPAAR